MLGLALGEREGVLGLTLGDRDGVLLGLLKLLGLREGRAEGLLGEPPLEGGV